MGLLDEVVKHVAAQGGGDATHAAMTGAVLDMLSGRGAAGGGGGLPSLVEAFEAQGLSHVMDSWVGTGPNKAISPEQVHAVLGQDQIARLGQQAGLSPEIAKTVLAVVLP